MTAKKSGNSPKRTKPTARTSANKNAGARNRGTAPLRSSPQARSELLPVAEGQRGKIKVPSVHNHKH